MASVPHKVKVFIEKNRLGDVLDLTRSDIEDLEPIVQLLAGMPNLKELNLSHNHIRTLPSTLASLPHLETLRLTGNKALNARQTLKFLQKMKTLTHLWLDVADSVTRDAVASLLPGLKSFNGTPLTAEMADDEENETPQSLWTESDSEAALSFFSDITKDIRNSPQKDYSDYVNRVANHVNCLAVAEGDAACQEGERLKAQRLLLEFSSKVYVRHLTRENEAVGGQVGKILQACLSLLDQHDAHWRSIVEERDRTLRLMQEDVRAARVEIESFVTSQQNTLITDSSPMKQSPGSHLATPNASAKGRRLGSISKSRQVDSECRAESQPPKTLTLKQLRSFIEEIYASKERYDDKCKQSNMPYETMEQHMYTYLNQRYGLKELVVEWATAIVNGVKKHAASANDVVVFGRILRNEIEEEFRFVQMKLRETAEELLLQQLKGRHPLKSDVELGRLLEKKKEKGLREEEWTYIVEYLYNADDAASLSSVVRKQLFLSHSSRPSGAKSDPLIPYDDFVVVLLDFQLANHQRFLEPLVSAFKSVDTDRNGIVDGAEFRRVVLCLREDALEEDINQLLRQIDPLGSQVIVFSRCVPVLANLLTE